MTDSKVPTPGWRVRLMWSAALAAGVAWASSDPGVISDAERIERVQSQPTHIARESDLANAELSHHQDDSAKVDQFEDSSIPASG